MINKVATSILDDIDRAYTNPKTYAKSCSEYLRTKSKVFTDYLAKMQEIIFTDASADALARRTNEVEGDVYYYDVAQYLDNHGLGLLDGKSLAGSATAKVISFAPSSYDMPLVDLDDSTSETAVRLKGLLNEIANGTLVCEDSICPVSDYLRAACAVRDGLVSASSECINTASGKLVSLDAINTFSANVINNGQVVVESLNSLASGSVQTMSDFVADAKVRMGETLSSSPLFATVSQLFSSSGSLMDTVKGVVSLVADSCSQAATTASDETGFLSTEMRRGEYSGVNPTVAWATAKSTVFTKAATAVKQVVGTVVGVVGAVLKTGAKLVKKAYKKYVEPAVTNPVFVQTSNYDRDFLDYPIYSVRWGLHDVVANLPATDKIGDGTMSSLLAELGVHDRTSTPWVPLSVDDIVNELFGLCEDGQAVVIDTILGQIIFYRVANTDDCLIEVYCTPTAPINVDELKTYLAMEAANDHSVRHRSFVAAIDHFLPRDPSVIQIDPLQLQNNDKYFISCIQATIWRWLVYARLRACVYDGTEEADMYYSSEVYETKYAAGLLQVKLGPDGDLVKCIAGVMDINGGPFVPPIYIPVIDVNDTHMPAAHRLLNLELPESVSNTSVLQYAAFTDGTLVYDGSAVSRPTMNVYSVLVACFLMQVGLNKYNWMSQVYENLHDWTVFMPYKLAVSMDVGRYHMQTDAQLEAKAEKLKDLAATITTLVLAAAAYVAYKIVVGRKLSAALEKVGISAEGKRYAYEDMLQAYNTQSQYNFGAEYPVEDQIWRIPTKEDIKKAQKEYNRAARTGKLKARVLGKLGAQSLTYDFIDTSNSDEGSSSLSTENLISQTTADLGDDIGVSTTKLDDILKLLK